MNYSIIKHELPHHFIGSKNPARLNMLDLRVSLGLRLEELRIGANLTRDELAKKTGIDPRTIAAYELEGIYPKPDKLSKIREALDIEFIDVDVEFRDIFDFTDQRMKGMIPLEERLKKRVAERSDKGRTRKRPSRGSEEPRRNDGE